MTEKEKILAVFGARLKEIREKKGISLREMELEGELDRHILSKIENGKTNLTLYSMKKICKVLDITFEELFSGFKE